MGADKHEGRFAVRESHYSPGTVTNLPVKAFGDVAGADERPMFVEDKPAFSPSHLQPSSPSLSAFFCSGLQIHSAVSPTRQLAFWTWMVFRLLVFP